MKQCNEKQPHSIPAESHYRIQVLILKTLESASCRVSTQGKTLRLISSKLHLKKKKFPKLKIENKQKFPCTMSVVIRAPVQSSSNKTNKAKIRVSNHLLAIPISFSIAQKRPRLFETRTSSALQPTDTEKV